MWNFISGVYTVHRQCGYIQCACCMWVDMWVDIISMEVLVYERSVRFAFKCTRPRQDGTQLTHHRTRHQSTAPAPAPSTVQIEKLKMCRMQSKHGQGHLASPASPACYQPLSCRLWNRKSVRTMPSIYTEFSFLPWPASRLFQIKWMRTSEHTLPSHPSYKLCILTQFFKL